MEWPFFDFSLLFLHSFHLLVIFVKINHFSSAFSYPDKGFLVYFEIIVEICFGIDIALNFISAYENEEVG